MDTTPAPRERERLVSELTEFLSIPSVSALPEHRADCRRAAEWLAADLRRLGCPVVTLIEGNGHPVVWAESPRVPNAPTLLLYGHYDVQPADPLEEWHSPPFTPTVRDGRLYARGAADDKGQVFCLLRAYEAVRDRNGRPPVNVHFIFEGEEESGGRVIDDLLAREPERTRWMRRWWPTCRTTPLGGPPCTPRSAGCVTRRSRSGRWSGICIPGPTAAWPPTRWRPWCASCSQLKDASGRIRLPGLYESVKPPTRGELDSWRRLPFRERQFLKEEVTGKALTGLRRYSVFERTWALPTFEIHGITGGFTGQGAKTVIPAQASAKVSLRLVPGLPMVKVERLLTRTVKALAPKWAEVRVRLHHGGDPVVVPVKHRIFDILDQAFESVVGRKTVRIRAGGSIPIVPRLAARGAPVLLTGIGLPDDGLHSPNEKLDLKQLWDGIAVFGKFFELMGGEKSRS